MLSPGLAVQPNSGRKCPGEPGCWLSCRAQTAIRGVLFRGSLLWVQVLLLYYGTGCENLTESTSASQGAGWSWPGVQAPTQCGQMMVVCDATAVLCSLC